MKLTHIEIKTETITTFDNITKESKVESTEKEREEIFEFEGRKYLRYNKSHFCCADHHVWCGSYIDEGMPEERFRSWYLQVRSKVKDEAMIIDVDENGQCGVLEIHPDIEAVLESRYQNKEYEK